MAVFAVLLGFSNALEHGARRGGGLEGRKWGLNARDTARSGARAFLETAGSELLVPLDVEVFLIGFDADGGYAHKQDAQALLALLTAALNQHCPHSLASEQQLGVCFQLNWQVMGNDELGDQVRGPSDETGRGAGARAWLCAQRARSTGAPQRSARRGSHARSRRPRSTPLPCRTAAARAMGYRTLPPAPRPSRAASCCGTSRATSGRTCGTHPPPSWARCGTSQRATVKGGRAAVGRGWRAPAGLSCPPSPWWRVPTGSPPRQGSGRAAAAASFVALFPHLPLASLGTPAASCTLSPLPLGSAGQHQLHHGCRVDGALL